MIEKKFTLIEMLVVIGIIATLAAIVIPVTGMARNKARMTECRNNMCSLMKSMQNYANDNGQCIVYRAGGKNYAAILNGNDARTKSYLPQPQILSCTKNEQKFDKDFTNAAGMLNAYGADGLTNSPGTGAWLSQKNKGNEKFSAVFSSFASSPDNSSIVYDLSKVGSSYSRLQIFADTFRRNAKQVESYWNFTPHQASNSNYYVTLIHSGRTVGAFADAHAAEMDAPQLKECGTEVTAFNDEDFSKDKSSDH